MSFIKSHLYAYTLLRFSLYFYFLTLPVCIFSQNTDYFFELCPLTNATGNEYPCSSYNTMTLSGPRYPDDRKTTEQERRMPEEIAKIRARTAGINNPDTIPSFTFPKNNILTESELIEEQRRNIKRVEKERQREAQKQKQKEEKIIEKEVTKKLSHQTNRIKDVTQQTSSLLSQYAQEDKPPHYVTKRATYLKKYHDDPDYYKYTTYSDYSNYKTTSLLEEHNIDTSEFYKELYGNHLQHGIHEEYLSIISHTTTIKFDTNHCQLRSFIVLAVQTSRDNNVKGNCITSLEINDICHHILNPTHHGSLAGQIAHIQTTIKYYTASHWKQALGYLEETALYDQEIRACLNAVKKFTEQFEAVQNSQYNLQVIEVMQELNVHELSHLAAQEQFEILEKHHEAIAIKALRALHQQPNAKELPMYNFVISLFKLRGPYSESNAKLIQSLLEPIDSINRIIELTNTPYSSSQQKNPFFTEQGILKEYAMIAEIDQLPIPPLDRLRTPKSTHNLLYTYCTTKNPNRKKLAHCGLYHATCSATNQNVTCAESHEWLARKYESVLKKWDYQFKKQSAVFLEWCDNLAQKYENPYQQDVHDELVWFTHYYLDTHINNIPRSNIFNRLLEDVKDTLITAHAYNQHNQPEKSHELIENLVYNFGSSTQENQQKPDIFQPLDLINISKSVSNEIKTIIEDVTTKTHASNYNPEEKIQYVTHALSKLQIHHGKLTQKAQDDSSQKTPEPAKQPLYASELLGFSIKADANTIDIGYIPKNDLKTFKDNWPNEEVVDNVYYLWREEVPLYAAGSQAAACKRYADRYQAYQETKNNPYVFVERTYAISQEAQQFLDKNEIESNHLKAGTYNPIQHELHTELLDILEQTTVLDAQEEVSDLLRSTNTMMLDWISTAAYENKNGNIYRTWTIADFCWATLDCGQAVLEGFKDGGFDALKYPFTHPVETVLFTVAGKYMLYYQVAKLAYELGIDVYDHYSKTPEQEKKSTEKSETEIQLRDIFKAASSFGTQFLVNHKLINPLVSKSVDILQNKLTDKLILENNSLWPKHKPNPAHAPQTAQVQLANGEKIEVALHNESLGQRPQGSSALRKPQNASDNKNEYPRPSDEEIARNRANKKLLEKARKQEAIEKQSKKAKNIEQQKLNTARNLKNAKQCLLHAFEEYEKYLLKKLEPHREFLYKKYGFEIKGANIAHWMELDWNSKTKNFTGFHSTYLHPEHVMYYTHGPNLHGISKAIVGKSGKFKPSSLYPKKWDINTISDKIVEALLTGVKETSPDGIHKISGIAQNYIPGKGIRQLKIEMYVSPNGIIDSTWPIYSLKG